MLSKENWFKKLGIQNLNKKILDTALTHSSYKGMGHKVEDNERLEFLGDAVLDLINAKLLYDDSSLSEADMTEMRKSYVSNSELAKIFNGIGIGEYLHTAKNLKLSNKIKADFIEALFGAVFVASGYPKCLKLWNTVQNIVYGSILPSKTQLKKSTTPAKQKPTKGLKNAKNTLVEFCQKHSFMPPEYKQINKQGPDHNPIYTVRLQISAGGNQKNFRSIFKLSSKQKLRATTDGTGKKIKLAEMKAAQKMCNKIGLKYSK